MPLVKSTLKAAILAVFETAASNETATPEQSRENIAEGIANAVDAYIKSATINVTTTGTAAAQTGTGTIS